MTAPPPRPHVAVTLLIFGAAALVVGVMSKSWWVHDSEGFIGPTGAETCGGDGCEPVTWEHLHRHGTPSYLAFVGQGLVLAAIATAGMALVLAALALARRPLPIEIAKIVFVTTAILLGVFALGLVSGENNGDWGGMDVGWAPIPAFAGLVASRLGLTLLARRAKAAQAGTGTG